MKKSKWLAFAGVALLSVGALMACSSKSVLVERLMVIFMSQIPKV